MIKLSIASWSFHRTLEAGKQDMFRYITDCKDLGATQLDPWNGHLAPLVAGDGALKKRGALKSRGVLRAGLTTSEKAYLEQVKAAAQKTGLPFGCLAVDGAHIYEPTAEARLLNRAVAYRWLEAAALLGATQVRVDAGGPPEMPSEAFEVIIEGYQDLIARARPLGIELLIENHWGPSPIAANLKRILDAVPGLGLLFDSNNFAGDKEAAWEQFAPAARSVHIKTFSFDEHGDDPSVDLAKAIRLLAAAGYQGAWGVESVPKDGDEYGGVRKTFALIRRILGE